MACRRASPHCRSPGEPELRTAAVELDAIDTARAGGLMAALSMGFTARFTASRLSVDIDVIEELVERMGPEDGCLSIQDRLAENAATVTSLPRFRASLLQ